ncbi:MAG: ribonuclease HII [Campylobacteraceae bacterium]|nr:ribonuclease HII [Campylobacteraceae bacterium]
MLCGIDEAGRGCLAGPLVVAGCVLYETVNSLDDSKALSPKRRDELFKAIKNNAKFTLVWFSHKRVDEWGLSKCLEMAILRIQKEFKEYEILMDGNCSFGVKNIKTLVKADALIPQVSAASILAKVARDRYMLRMSERYPNYGFSSHKGYGAKKHIDAIKLHGPSPIQRHSFIIKSLRQGSLF